MGVRYSPKIITDSIEAIIDPGNTKSQDGTPMQNRSNYPTNWGLKRSNYSDVTGTIDPPTSLPSGTPVAKLTMNTSPFTNGLHRATNGTAGFVMTDPDLQDGGTRWNMWVRGEVGNGNTVVSIDIGDDSFPSADSVTVADSSIWQYLYTWNNPAQSASLFFDFSLSPYINGDVVYICGDTIVQSNTEITTNLQKLPIDPIFIEHLGTKGVDAGDLFGNTKKWTLNETKWLDGYYIFDASSMYIKSNFNTPSNLQGDPDFSVMQVIRRTGTIAGGASWSMGGDSSNQGFSSYTGPSGVDNTISFDQWGVTTIYVTGQIYPLDEWVIIHWIKSTGNVTINNLSIYINENKYTDTDLTYNRQGSGTPNINSGGLTIGRAGATTNAYYVNNADIGTTIFYSKVLSDEEVQNNVRIFKSRYGIS